MHMVDRAPVLESLTARERIVLMDLEDVERPARMATGADTESNDVRVVAVGPSDLSDR